MSYSDNHIIHAPISINDVQKALSNSSCDLGTLISNSIVNKWAKWKPIKVAKVIPLVSSDWVSANYGITDIPTWTRLSYASTFLFSDNRSSLSNIYWPECDRSKGSLSLEYWAHQKPTGGNAGPYRLSDFDNYYRDAEAPIGLMTQSSINIAPDGKLRISFGHGAISDYTLKLSELTWPGSTNYPIGNMYFGVMMKQVTGGHSGGTYVATQNDGESDITMSQTDQYGFWTDFSPSIVDAQFAGTWKVYPIISSVAIAETTSISQQDGNKFLAPLPMHDDAVTIGIQYAEIAITNAHGRRMTSSESARPRASFGIILTNTEPSGSPVRHCSGSVILCDQYGEKINGSNEGTFSLQGSNGIAGGAQKNVDVEIDIAAISSATIYYRIELSITDSLKFKRSSSRGTDGPIVEEDPLNPTL